MVRIGPSHARPILETVAILICPVGIDIVRRNGLNSGLAHREEFARIRGSVVIAINPHSKPRKPQPGNPARHLGFRALAMYDRRYYGGNDDGVIDSKDAVCSARQREVAAVKT